jgi:hypothetical protein
VLLLVWDSVRWDLDLPGDAGARAADVLDSGHDPQ